MTHHLPLLAMLLLGFAASTLLSMPRTTTRAVFAMATDMQHAPVTPYGSGAAIRNLLF